MAPEESSDAVCNKYKFILKFVICATILLSLSVYAFILWNVKSRFGEIHGFVLYSDFVFFSLPLFL